MTFNEIETEFNKEFIVMYSGDAKRVKSFLTQSHIRLLQSLKEELPEERGITFETSNLQAEVSYSAGYNDCLFTTHQLIDNAIKSIEV